jgi:PAS domain S-box-containing protein
MVDLAKSAAPRDDWRRRCMSDLITLVALPAMWSGGDLFQIGNILLDALQAMLDVDLLYLRLMLPDDPARVELARLPTSDVAINAQEVGASLDSALGPLSAWPASANLSLGRGLMVIAHAQVGLGGAAGVLVAGCHGRLLSQEERLVLNVGANQAALAVNEAARHVGQAKLAAMLEKRIAERTMELATANVALKKEIAEREQTEEALRKSERTARRLVDSMPGMVAILSSEGVVEAVNAQLTRYCGVSLEEFRNWQQADIIHLDDLPTAIRIFNEAISAEQNFDLEVRVKGSAGDYRWFQVHGVPFPDPSTAPWYVFLTDIDDRRRAEAARAANEQKLQEIVDAIPVMAWAAAPSGEVEYLNEPWLEFAGIAADEADHWWAAVHPDDVAGLLKTWEEVLHAGVPGEAEARIRRRDGEYRWFLIRSNPVFAEDGSVARWYGTNTDIDDRKKAEDKLRHSEMLLAEGERMSHTGTFCWQLATDEVIFSDELSRIFGFEKDAVITMEAVATRVHPDDREVLARRRDEIRAGAYNPEYEARIISGDGSVHYLRVVARSLEYPDGHVECIGAGQDITERRLAEEARDRFRAELSQITRVMSLGMMTASIAHEVNQPLSGIITNAGTSLRMLAATPPNVEGALEAARRTMRDGQRASEVVGKVRALFRKQPATLEPLDLNDAAREVVGLIGSDLQRNRIALRLDLSDQLPGVDGDRVQLQQVIMNLFRNAIDAIGELAHQPREIALRTAITTEGLVELAVRDTGSGIATDIEQLFTAFHTTKSDGMGIGLSVSRSIVEAHNGQMYASSNEKAGATFGFRLPSNSAPQIQATGLGQARTRR